MKYKRGMVVSARADIRAIASIADFFEKEGLSLKTRSSIAGHALNIFADLLCKENRARDFETQEEALAFIREKNISLPSRLPDTIIRGLSLEALDEVDDESDIQDNVRKAVRSFNEDENRNREDNTS